MPRAKKEGDTSAPPALVVAVLSVDELRVNHSPRCVTEGTLAHDKALHPFPRLNEIVYLGIVALVHEHLANLLGNGCVLAVALVSARVTALGKVFHYLLGKVLNFGVRTRVCRNF